MEDIKHPEKKIMGCFINIMVLYGIDITCCIKNYGWTNRFDIVI